MQLLAETGTCRDRIAEVFLAQRIGLQILPRHDRGIAGLIGNQRLFAETMAGAKGGEFDAGWNGAG